MNYFYAIEKDDCTYSVDMLRFHVHLPHSEKSAFLSFMDSTIFTKRWEDHGFGRFALNWSFSTLWVGFGTRNEGTTHLVCFEFNPAKMSRDEWYIFYRCIDIFGFILNLRRFDLAVDIPFNINDLKFTSLTKRCYSVFFKDFNDKTFYMGKGNGHIKIYNKKIESDLDFELTRFEVTREVNFVVKDYLNNISDFDFKFPSFTFSLFTYDKSLGTDDTLDAIQFSINNGFPFNSLSRTYKKYFKRNIQSETYFDSSTASRVFQKTLKLINDKCPLI